MDEPSIGLHQRDNLKLIESLKKLKELGNTLIIVEHDEDMMRNADWIVDLGPEGGLVLLLGNGTRHEVTSAEQVRAHATKNPYVMQHIRVKNDVQRLNALAANLPGYSDYVDADGRYAGRGPQPPSSAAFVRRWSVVPLTHDPDRAVVLQVVASRVTRPAAHDAHVVSVLARTAR